MIYTVNFTGRKADAIGIFYPITTTIEATSHDDFIEQFYKRYECGPDRGRYLFDVTIERQPADDSPTYENALYYIAK